MIKYLIMDVDGSLTDGKIYMSPNGEAMKAFSIKDGLAISYLIKAAEIIPVVITARRSDIVQCRCNELGIERVFQGRLDKLTALKEIVREDCWGECAYFGDDILDIECMTHIKREGGIVGCPADAISEVKVLSDFVSAVKAGEGALREYVEWLISNRNDETAIRVRIDGAIKYLKNINVLNAVVGRRIDVDNGFYYSIQNYITKPPEECRLESHRKYIDIQIIVSGREIMDVVDIARLTVMEEYNEERDVVYWNVPNKMSRITLSEGDCIVLYPEMAHRGAQKWEGEEQVVKILGKVRI